MPHLTPKDFEPVVKRVEPQLPLPGRKKSRQNQILKNEGEYVSREQIASAVTYMEEAAAGSLQIAEQYKQLATGVRALLETGLTTNALALLVTDVCPRAKNGSRISFETVQSVLEGLGRLHEHIKP